MSFLYPILSVFTKTCQDVTIDIVTTNFAFYIQSLDLLLLEFFKYPAKWYGALPVYEGRSPLNEDPQTGLRHIVF